MTGDMTGLLDQHHLVVCVGSGGVGKTTTAAALALAAAGRGRRVAVVTIDPARRLADAMGMGGGLTGDPRRLDLGIAGELWASMLDTRATFDRVVMDQASDPEQARRILSNPFYDSMAGALSGTQEYMATEELYALAGDRRFDLVVVDTPPSRRALDVVDAPQRLVSLLENRVYRMLTAPSRGVVRVLSRAARTFVRRASTVVGTQVLEDAVAFFEAFEGMEEGFRARARAVTELLAGDETAFVLVASPRPDTVDEAVVLHDALGRRGIAVDALVVNLLHPDPAAAIVDGDRAQLDRLDPGHPLAGRWQAALDLSATADRERAAIAPLCDRLAGRPGAFVERFEVDVRDLAGLDRFGAELLGVQR
jgi:anion-transporting  ArsA/GET3 family ATPase